MPDLFYAALSAADPITPDSVVAMPVGVMWSGVGMLFVVMLFLWRISWQVSGFKTTVEATLKDHGERLHVHSDLFDSNTETHHAIDKRLSAVELRNA